MNERLLLQVGTSGWVYAHWMGIFYPTGMHDTEQLPFYARRYHTVEVNYSFYRLPERSVFEHWRAQTPNDFLFAVKGSRYLTHIKKLREPEEPMARLMERARGLGPKLGPVLFQFPPTWSLDMLRFEAFAEVLGTYGGQQFACEFRHDSWFTPRVYDLLERAGIALVIAVRKGLPLNLRLTAAWTYVRVHGGEHGIGLTDEEIVPWAARIRDWNHDGRQVYMYFNNDPGGHALYNADRLLELVHH